MATNSPASSDQSKSAASTTLSPSMPTTNCCTGYAGPSPQGSRGDGLVGGGEVGLPVGVGVIDDSGRRVAVQRAVQLQQVGRGEHIRRLRPTLSSDGMTACALHVVAPSDRGHRASVSRANQPPATLLGERGSGLVVDRLRGDPEVW